MAQNLPGVSSPFKRKPTLLSTSFGKSFSFSFFFFFFFFFFFPWRWTQKEYICKRLSWFNAKPFVVTTYAQKRSFILVNDLKHQIFSRFSLVKINANYAEICRVGNLEADFPQVPLVPFLLIFLQYCCETSIIQIKQSKMENIFIEKTNKQTNKQTTTTTTTEKK